MPKKIVVPVYLVLTAEEGTTRLTDEVEEQLPQAVTDAVESGECYIERDNGDTRSYTPDGRVGEFLEVTLPKDAVYDQIVAAYEAARNASKG